MSKAIVISPFWATIIGGVMTSGILGGVTYAVDAHSQQAVTKEKIEKMEQANLPERMARIEETVKSTDKTVDDIKAAQREQTAMQMDINRKIDQLIQNGRGR